MKLLKVFLALALLAATLAIPVGASAQDEGGAEPAGPTIDGVGDDGGGGATEIPVLEPSEADPWLEDVLPESTQGAEALELLDAATLDEVAAQNSMSTAQLTAILADDADAWLDADGILLYMDPPTPAEYMTGEPAAPGPFPNSQTFLLHSRPGSNKVLYLDFDGYNLPAGTGWRSGNAYTALPWDTNGNGGTWSQSEHDTIQSVWQRVSEDYAPFDVDVTTQDPGFAAIDRSGVGDTNYGTRVVITDSPNADFCGSPCGGIAYVGTFDIFGGNGHAYYQPAWSFSDGVGDTAHNLAEVSSHEAGHNVGLSHDGINGGVEYYAGHGMWAPIMGSSYGQPVTQWSKGEYTNPSNTQDDFPVIVSNGPQLVADDVPWEFAATFALVSGQTQLVGKTPAQDIDTFDYTPACSGSFTFDFNPAAVSPNLNILAQIYEGTTLLETVNNNVVRVSSDVATGMDATITRTLTGGTLYHLAVFPGPQGTPQNGFSDYGSVGEYTIDVTEPGGCCVSNDAYATPVALGTVDEMKTTVTGDNTCATSETGETTGGAGQTLWYSFVADATGTATVSTCSTNTVIDTELGIFTNGATVASATLIKADDDPTGPDEDRCSVVGLQSQITIPVVGGTTYRVQVDRCCGLPGVFELSVQQHWCGVSSFGRPATMVGSDGADFWAAIPADQSVVGLDGGDAMTVVNTATNVWLCGEGGNDDLRGSANADVVLGGDDDDQIRGFGGNDFLAGDCEKQSSCDTETPGDGNDTIRGGGGNDIIWGTGGLDNVIAGGGGDLVDGGSGNDSLNGGADADTIYGRGDNDTVRGQGDVDTQEGNDGDDVMRGHAGNDIMRGGNGNDTLLASTGDDQLFGGPNDDTLWAGAGADFLNGGTGTNDFCHGGSDNDVDTHTQCEILRKLP